MRPWMIAALSLSILTAAVVAVVLPRYLDARREANTPRCIGTLQQRLEQAEKTGCKP